MRISGFEMPARSRMFSSPDILILSILNGGSDATRPNLGARGNPAAPAAFRARRRRQRIAPIWRAANALPAMERRGRARNRAALRPREERRAAERVAVLCALCESDQRAQA